MNYSNSQPLVDEILKYVATHDIEHKDMVYALLILLRADMKAFGDSEHNLIDDNGVCLVNVRLFE
ncbi:hypothetical protein [Hafnia phage Pocis76]|uniref:Uncharacterized protein n=1 Tax=Hafnia phage Pocis76 TaxID=2831174 RepID=A0A8E7FNU0_9CAUD|nr:hypothetical protein [Hafnia phage Pocis76]